MKNCLNSIILDNKRIAKVITILSLKFYKRTIVKKKNNNKQIMWYWHKNRQVDKWNKIEVPKIHIPIDIWFL